MVMIGTRITQRMLTDTAYNGMQSTLNRSQQLQEQLSSGKLLNQPSDNPAAATNSMQLRSKQRLDDQYQVNIDDAAGRLATADSALRQISELLQNAKDLVVNAQDEALGVESKSAITTELGIVQKSIVDAYNTQWQGRPIFGGTMQGTVAVDANNAYLGNDQPTLARIASDVVIRTDIKGSAAGADVLPALLAKIGSDIDSGSPDVSANQDALDSAYSTVLTAIGDIGARAAQVDSTKTRITSEQLDIKTRISENEDVDLPKAILDLQASQVAYQASLGSAAKVLQVSLLDYLR